MRISSHTNVFYIQILTYDIIIQFDSVDYIRPLNAISSIKELKLSYNIFLSCLEREEGNFNI